MTTTATYSCPYCRQDSTPSSDSCPLCGAPVNIRLVTTAGGWTEMPPISDMTRIQAGQSSIQVEGTIAPAADWNLAAGDGVYFPHHVLLWQDPAVVTGSMPLSKP